MNAVRTLARPLLGAVAVTLLAAPPTGATHLGYVQRGHTVAGNTTSGLSGSVEGALFQGLNSSSGNTAYGLLGTIPATSPGLNSAGVRGSNAGTTGNGMGVWGTHAGYGRGVYGQSVNGTGVHGHHTSTTGDFPGVRGTSASTHEQAAGVLGRITSTGSGRYSAGVRGTNAGTGGFGYGVFGSHDGAGPGVRGSSASGFGGEFVSENYRGMYVRGGPSWIAAYVDGWAYVNGNLDVTANAWITGDLMVSGQCTGCTDAMRARNSGSEAIAAGDLVEATGVEVDPDRGEPVLQVRRAGRDGDAVVGVAGSAVAPATAGEEGEVARDGFVPVEGDAAPEDYVRVITSGLAQVRVGGDAPRIGERLAAGGNGRATRGTTGEGIARAMSRSDADGLVWALVDGG